MATERRDTAPVWWLEARGVGTKVNRVAIPSPTCVEDNVMVVVCVCVCVCVHVRVCETNL